MEKILTDCHNFGAVIKKDTISSITHFVAKTVLCAEINEFGDQFVTWLLLSSCDQPVTRDGVSNCCLNFCQFLLHSLLWNRLRYWDLGYNLRFLDVVLL